MGPYTNVFTNIAPNTIITANHLTTVALKSNDKIINTSGLKKYDVNLYQSSNSSVIETKSFTSLDHITPTITFDNLTEGQTYYATVVVTNDLNQLYTIRLENDITTNSEAPITSTALSTSDAKMNDKPSIEITGFAVNDENSSYDVYIAALQSNIPGSLTTDNIKDFFDSVANTKRFDGVLQNTVTNIVTSKGSMTNGDGVFDVSGNPKIVKAYDYDSKTVSDIAKDTTKLVLIAMVRDRSVQKNYITFKKEHNYTYDISNIAFTNVKNTSSNFVTTGDVVNMTFTTNYAVNASKLSSTFYGASQTFNTSDGGVNWTVGLTIPGSAGDESLIKENTTLSIDLRPIQTLATDIQVDKTAPVWNFGTVTSSADGVINAQVTLTSDIASAEPMRFVLEASNDGSTATAVDAGKTLVTTDTFLTFSSPSTQTVSLTDLSPGLDYFIKGQLWDVNSNLKEMSFINPEVHKGVIFTKDSILPIIVVDPVIYPSLENVRVEGLQVKDNNSIYGYVVAITESSSSFTYDEYKEMKGEGKDVFLNENIPRGTTDTLTSRTFTKYIKSDRKEDDIQSGTAYKLVVIIKDVFGGVKLYEKSFITEYPVVLSDTVDTSGAGGVLTHLFNYDLKSLTNSLGSPHGLVSGIGNVTYVDGFVGSNAVFLNSNVTDDHSIRVSSESMSNHTEFSFATWLKSYNANWKTLFYYDDYHYLRIKDSEIQSKWGVAATLSIDTMEYTNTDWNHIVMTANTFDTSSASNVTIYWNSSNINAGGAGITHVPSTKTEFYIGGEPTSASGGSNFKGILDDTRIYNSIITSDDVGLLYGAGGNALEITFDETGNLVFSNESGELTQDQITELLDTTDTATGDVSITFDGDTTLELSGTQLDGIETTDGVLTESTVSFWIKPTDDTFAQENVIIEYFASIGYTVTILPNGTLKFDVVDNTPAVSARYWRLVNVKVPADGNYYQPSEVAIYDENFNKLSATLTGSGWDTDVSNLNDNNKDTRSSIINVNTNTTHYLQWDLVSAQEVKYVSSRNSDATNRYLLQGNLQYSSDGLTWNDLNTWDLTGSSAIPNYAYQWSPYINIYNRTFIGRHIYIYSGAASGMSWRFDPDATERTATNYFYYIYDSTGVKNTDKQHAIQYNTETQKWSSSSTAKGFPVSFETSANPQTVTTNRTSDIYGVFTNPFYVAP